jgi:hypothetical protein
VQPKEREHKPGLAVSLMEGMEIRSGEFWDCRTLIEISDRRKV